jgi:hypothetical protein
MHNVNVEAVERTAARAKEDPAVMLRSIAFDGSWQTTPAPRNSALSSRCPAARSATQASCDSR